MGFILFYTIVASLVGLGVAALYYPACWLAGLAKYPDILALYAADETTSKAATSRVRSHAFALSCAVACGAAAIFLLGALLRYVVLLPLLGGSSPSFLDVCVGTFPKPDGIIEGLVLLLFGAVNISVCFFVVPVLGFVAVPLFVFFAGGNFIAECWREAPNVIVGYRIWHDYHYGAADPPPAIVPDIDVPDRPPGPNILQVIADNDRFRAPIATGTLDAQSLEAVRRSLEAEADALNAALRHEIAQAELDAVRAWMAGRAPSPSQSQSPQSPPPTATRTPSMPLDPKQRERQSAWLRAQFDAAFAGLDTIKSSSPCPDCKGTGKIETRQGFLTVQRPCSRCQGKEGTP